MSTPRFFLFSYDNLENFNISKANGLLGCNDGRGKKKKFFKLQERDIVIIRDSSKSELKFFGYGVVIGEPWDANTSNLKGQVPDLLWTDELKEKVIKYPFRIHVNFKDPLPLQRLHKIKWDDILRLGWKNKKTGKVMTKNALGPFFSGNFVEEDNRFSSEDIKAFVKLMGMESYEPKENVYVEEPLDDRRLKEIGDAGESFIFKLLNNEFGGSNFEVIWTSRIVPTSPYDIQVNQFNKPYLYVEVKTTIRGNLSTPALISEREVQWRQEHFDSHRLYYVIYDGNINDNPQVYHLRKGDYKLYPIKYELRVCKTLDPVI